MREFLRRAGCLAALLCLAPFAGPPAAAAEGAGPGRPVDARASLDLLVRTLSGTTDSAVRAALLRGMLSGLEGRRNVPAPRGWEELAAALAGGNDPEIDRLTQRLGEIFGDQAATAKALATLRDPGAPAAERRASLAALVAQQNPALAPVLATLLDDPRLQVDAIRAYGAIEDPRAPEILLSRYASLGFQGRRAVVETLATRKTYATALTAAIGDKRVPRGDVPAYIARALSGLLGASFTAVYGDIRELSKDKAELIAKYRRLLTPDAVAKANASRGRAVFQGACASCHVLYGEGGVIGPELTGSNRADLDYILLNMIDPSADIPDAYRLVTLTTKDGEVLAGTLAGEDDQRVVLHMVGQKRTVLRSDIATRDVSPFSMMPEGLLPTLKDNQVLDLVKYLQTTRQVPLPE